MINKALIIFGATGSLAHEKIFPSIHTHFRNKSKSFINLEIIGYGRHSSGPLLEGFKYIQGEINDLAPLLKFIKEKKIHKIYFYISLPPNLYIETINSIQKSFKGYKIKIALEKPFGSSLEEAEKLSKVVLNYENKNFYLIDHYLAKQSVINFLNISESYKDVKNIQEIEMSILEDNNVYDRGAFYDDLGAIKDTGQNHILNTLARLLSNGDRKFFFKNIRYIKGSLLLGQYDGYLETPEVKKNSNTETYFKAKLKYEEVNVIIRSGKGLDKTQIYLNIHYKNSEKLYIEIKPKQLITPEIVPWPTETVTPHEYIIEDFINDKNNFSITLDEAILAWKITEGILGDKNNSKLKTYPKGSNFEEIES